MLIPIVFNPKSSTSTSPKLPSALAKISNDEVILIELQGVLEVEVAQPTDKNGKFVGKLTIDEDGSGKPTLLIGHNLLEGKIATLNKPLAILTRSLTDVNSLTNTTAVTGPSKGRGKDADAIEVDGDGSDGKDQSAAAPLTRSTQWEAVALIKRKIVFAKRPMLIVNPPS